MPLDVSAILTTRNRANLLPAVLAGLQAQTLPADRFEVVVIDDGSTDDTPAILAAWRDRLPLRVERVAWSGLSAAKNLGILLSRGHIVVSLDDDDVAQPELLIAHVAAHIVHPDPAMAVLGRTTLAPGIAALPLMRHVTEVGCQLFSYGWMKPGQVLDHTCFWGGRSSAKRELLVRHGLFHTPFTFGCEDIELGWRLARHGLRVAYEPRAHTVMIRALSFDDFCNRSYRQGLAQAAFAVLHPVPEVRRYCEIDEAQALWAEHRFGFAAHIRRTRDLDRLARARQEAGLAEHPVLQPALDSAYRLAFQLMRAKGVLDAQTETERRDGAPRPPRLLRHGLDGDECLAR